MTRGNFGGEPRAAIGARSGRTGETVSRRLLVWVFWNWAPKHGSCSVFVFGGVRNFLPAGVVGVVVYVPGATAGATKRRKLAASGRCRRVKPQGVRWCCFRFWLGARHFSNLCRSPAPPSESTKTVARGVFHFFHSFPKIPKGARGLIRSLPFRAETNKKNNGGGRPISSRERIALLSSLLPEKTDDLLHFHKITSRARFKLYQLRQKRKTARRPLWR